ncbi:cryptochrome/photolyase family protein [Sphingomonas oligophenolica]|uniref:Deoxyribodipyrimidine photo-lyase n=1 Tax=Sphingomonas oligophenolica TaxID=301154 RepID=A0A502CGI2_9SPHN|nr:deoxyribodipyrimidine photo-lyase [Sphingomonas oligophenolica]TPG12267.1 deoxyribodipyrimidine photo-lyase [Sphingomonas oligophenolica]
MPTPVILWVRQDLRLRDQPALVAAAHEASVIPVYILDDDAPGTWRIGAAQRWYLHQALDAFAASLKDKGSRLILRQGDGVTVLKALMKDTGATRIHAIRHYEPWWRKAEEALGDALCLHDGNYLAPVEDITTGAGTQYKVYSSFWKALAEQMPPGDPLPVPHTIPAPEQWPASDTLADWKLLPTQPDWSTGFDIWDAGEDAAHRAVDRFARIADDYDGDRNLPSIEGTARLSPHLHFGEISPRDIWRTIDGRGQGVQTFRKELAWRDFTAGVIVELPDYADANGRPRFDQLRWRSSKSDLTAWQQGRTGYPIVDAGMRQLWTTGWIHNRVRMIVASFLVKHLLIDWREGEKWFWDCLVDADYGNNSVNWQWVAGTGVDSNMFSRIMAPLSQSERFDAAGYIRAFVPELRDVPDAAIHDPEEAGCKPNAYPAKIIGHREARERALAAVKNV